MSTGSDDDGRELPDTTHRMPPSGGSGGRRPAGPNSPPPPPEAFRPAGPPPTADSFRPGRSLDPTAGTPRPGRPDSPAGPTRQDPYGRPYAPATGEHGATDRADRSPPFDPFDKRDGDRADQRDRADQWNRGDQWDQGGYAAAGSYDPSRDWERERARTAVPPHGAQPPGPTRAQDEPGTRRRRRWPKVLAIVAGVLVVLLVVADRVVATVVAPNIMKKEITASLAEANTDPNVPPAQVTDVSIGGIPFLSQVFLGKYKDIQLSLAGISVPDGPRISEVDARLQGLEVPFSDAIRDNVGAVPVEEVEATVSVTYADLNAWLPQATDNNLQVNPVDGGERVQASFDFDDPLFGTGKQTVKGTASFSVTNGTLTLNVSEVDLDGTIDLPGIPIPLPSVELPLPDLPFDLTVVDAGTDADGVSLTARARNVTLPAAE